MGKTQIKKGDRFQCIETVSMKDTEKIEYIKHKVYVSEQDGCITNESGEKGHKWDDELEFKAHFKRIISEETAKELIGTYKIEKEPHSFCETPNEKCSMNYCDENGCQNRKRISVPFHIENLIKKPIKKGDRFLCIEDGIMEDGSREYTKGKQYESEQDGCITNDSGSKFHRWGNFPDFLERLDGHGDNIAEKAVRLPNDLFPHFSIHKPQHYAKGIDTFTRMEANCTKEECLAFAKGNIDKYNFRNKGQDLEDLDKIIAYANWAKKILQNKK